MKWTLMLWGCMLAACATKPATNKAAAPTKPAPAQETSMVTASNDPPSELVIPGPDGKSRVLVTAKGILLQRQPNGPLEELDAPLDVEQVRWEEKMKELAEGVRWSPDGTRVCLLRECKRGSAVAIFALASQPAAEVELDTSVDLPLHEAVLERYGDKHRRGRFYYITLRRWIDEDHLEIEFRGNLEPKEGGPPEEWESYRGTARIELGPKSGEVKGEPKWEPLEKQATHSPSPPPLPSLPPRSNTLLSSPLVAV